MEHKLIFDEEITADRIAYVLSYVKVEDRRVHTCNVVNETILESSIKCMAPSYTVKPISYLSSSELMISMAQACHILMDSYVRRPQFVYASIINFEQLKVLRENHDVYFTDMAFKFYQKRPCGDYQLNIALENLKHLKDVFVAKFNFNVGETVHGRFSAIVAPSQFV